MLKRAISVILGVMMIGSAMTCASAQTISKADEKDMVQTVSASALPSKTPDDEDVSGGKVVDIKAGDTVTFSISMKTPASACGIALYLYYDADVLQINDKYGNNSGVKIVNDFGSSFVSTQRDGMVSYLNSSMAGYSVFDTSAELISVRFTAKSDAETPIYYNINNVCVTQTQYDEVVNYWSGGKEVLTGVVFSDKAMVRGADSKIGDADSNGTVTVSDVVKVSKYMCKASTLTEEQFDLADINGDGKITVADLIKIQQYVSNLITDLSVYGS